MHQIAPFRAQFAEKIFRGGGTVLSPGPSPSGPHLLAAFKGSYFKGVRDGKGTHLLGASIVNFL